jgi:L-rhamnose isomerase
VAAWVIGTRNFRKALLLAMLEPDDALKTAECRFDYTARLVLMEEAKSAPWPAVWEYYCDSKNMPYDREWLNVVRKYETDVLSKRG